MKKKWLVLSLLSFIAFFSFFFSGYNSSNQQNSVIAASHKKVLKSNKQIKKAIKKKYPNIKIKSVNGSYMGDQKTTQITIRGKENVTNKLTVKGMYMDIADVWRVFKKYDLTSYQNIGVSVKYPLEDEGGNSSLEYVIKTDITPAKLSMMNAKKFNFNNVPTFAVNFWQSDALPKIN